MVRHLLQLGSTAIAVKELAGLVTNGRRSRIETLERSKKVHMLVGLGVGTAVGVTTGILMAPRSGKETRSKIVSGTSEIIENAREELNTASNRVREAGRNAADTVKETADNARESVRK